MRQRQVKALPSNSAAWKRRILEKGIEDANIHKVELRSASTIKEEQFLALRVLWKPHFNLNVYQKVFDLQAWVTEAQEMLDEYESWQIYVKNCATDVKEMPESTFVMARFWQMMAARLSSNRLIPSVAFSPPPKVHNTRSRTGNLPKNEPYPETPTKSTGTVPEPSSDSSEEEPEEEEPEEEEPEEEPEEEDSPGTEKFLDRLYLPTKDEEIVTAALFNLLCGLTVHTGIPNRWTVHRKAFKAQFSHASFEARVDGYLEDISEESEKVRALVEVKPVKRAKKIVKIVMQEAAQMAAWIKSDPDENGCLNRPGRCSRLHVSQDRHEIFITFAEYDKEYIKYLNDDSDTDDLHFLTLHQFGPWNTTSPARMRDLGKFLLAISLRAQSDMKEEGVEVTESQDEKLMSSLADEENDTMDVDSDYSDDEEMDEEDSEEGDDADYVD
ncbi:hypothetical protein P170DRAFT_484535 [Aspergillus steynii IBT 23096]|uniref:Uncharacterized protein n=1 Tax=Aspergillus steynii IBT 23096 TaxID=1392250 RepID=A0A2I2GRS9_9EURO|nr:uncharacterized protein P170DRAFT_484535 [Aspergillus steynii IBT 23096]PLB55575.1 hypothetical protein P170DRAFT_484535 [Aspergillus steynii IBT 23096]